MTWDLPALTSSQVRVPPLPYLQTLPPHTRRPPSLPYTLSRPCSSLLQYVPFCLHLLMAESIPTFTYSLDLLSSHIGLSTLETNLDLLSTLMFTPAKSHRLGPHPLPSPQVMPSSPALFVLRNFYFVTPPFLSPPPSFPLSLLLLDLLPFFDT